MSLVPPLSRRWLIAGLAVTAFAARAGAAPEERSADGYRVLRARRGSAALRGAGKAPTPIWGYDGEVPGPTLRVRRGEEVKVRLINELPEATSMHWHGLRIPNAMDGTPLTQKPIAPGASFDCRFTPPDAGTFWYHPHANASVQLDRGLSGVLIVDEPEPPQVDRDIVLVLDDWRLEPDGTIDEASFGSPDDAAHAGRIGEHLTVNGAPAIDIPVKTNERLRLRIVNAANARIIPFRVGHAPVIMAIDGQPSEPFMPRNGRIVLGPANRVDLFVDMGLAPGAHAPIIIEADQAEVTIARFVYDGGAPARPAPLPDPKPLPPNPLPARMDFRVAYRLDVPIEGGAGGAPVKGAAGAGHSHGASGPFWTLAGRASTGHDGPALFSVKRGRTVMLAFQNRTAFPHSMHLHGHHFRLLDALDDGWKPFWLDTVVVPERQTSRIAFVADNPGKWVLHCHMLEHQDTGMGAWFEVI